MKHAVLWLVLALFPFAPALAGPREPGLPVLGLPVQCMLNTECDLQNHVDRGADEPRDYHCGSHTYKAHDGTDFRVRDPRKAVPVLAVLAGRVRSLRDHEENGLFLRAGKEAVKGRECGNGIVIDHDGGWQSQYCHLEQGSLRVKAGDSVTKGEPLAMVGLSGLTEFRHLHLTLRRDGRIIDPFDIGNAQTSCGGTDSLWDEPLRSQLVHRSGIIITTGFADADLTGPMLELGEAKPPQHRKAAAIIAYARAIHLLAGDRQTLTVTGPDGRGFARAESAPLAGNKAQYMLRAGRRLGQTTAWPAGIYHARYEIIRDGRSHAAQDFTVTIAD